MHSCKVRAYSTTLMILFSLSLIKLVAPLAGQIIISGMYGFLLLVVAISKTCLSLFGDNFHYDF
ncbi:hypothetical protein CW304_10400 [Bacillus sp. UFRGS-B20]|nr:hypothetical protein CW304_10400 [Bacillus sp. UFRGS-B20]